MRINNFGSIKSRIQPHGMDRPTVAISRARKDFGQAQAETRKGMEGEREWRE